jgi:hypothetical protein
MIGADVGGDGVGGLGLLDAVGAEHGGEQHEAGVIAAADGGVEHGVLLAHAPPGRHADRQRVGRRRVDQGSFDQASVSGSRWAISAQVRLVAGFTPTVAVWI